MYQANNYLFKVTILALEKGVKYVNTYDICMSMMSFWCFYC